MNDTGLFPPRNRSSENGVTIIIVTFAIAFLIIAVAALAIDVVALYNARNEARHAADAAALAGAKWLADSGLTSDTNLSSATSLASATNAARVVAKGTALQNKVAGRLLTDAEVDVSFPNQGDLAHFVVSPQVSVTVQRADVGMFFARAWGTRIVPVRATAIAEAFNPSNSSSLALGSPSLDVTAQCVKPWILPNFNPGTGTTFFDASTGARTSPSGVVGQVLTLVRACTQPNCHDPNSLPSGSDAPPSAFPNQVYYFYGNFLAPAAASLPSGCDYSSTCAYEQAIAGCSPQPISCQTGSLNSTVSVQRNPVCGTRPPQTSSGVSCLIHASPSNVAGGPVSNSNLWMGLGQDCLDGDATFCGGSSSSSPTRILAGGGNPLTASSAALRPNIGDPISTSSSLVTIPITDLSNVYPTLPPGGGTFTVHVLGFIQGFITQVGSGDLAWDGGVITIRIVNVSGCGTAALGNPVVGNGVSPVPVHLISN